VKVSNKLRWIGLGALILCLFAIVMVTPLCPSSFGYLNINDGTRKFEWKVLGWTYKVRVDETDYSSILRKLNMTSAKPQWKLTSETKTKLFGKEYCDYGYGRIAHYADRFAATVGTNNSTKTIALEEVRHFRDLVANGDSDAIRKYMVSIGALGRNE
jgi:hypothetical protein